MGAVLFTCQKGGEQVSQQQDRDEEENEGDTHSMWEGGKKGGTAGEHKNAGEGKRAHYRKVIVCSFSHFELL